MYKRQLLRHAAIIALSRVATPQELTQYHSDDSDAVKIACVVALRRLNSPLIEIYLKDNNEFIVTEASRGINDDNSIEKSLPTLANLLNNTEFENEEDFEFDVDKDHSKQQSGSDVTDVVFGSGMIRVPSMEKFVLQYPESALKFLMRQNIDGKPLPSDIVLVHAGWEERGLSRNMLKKYVLELMQWSDFPDLPFQDFYLQIRNRIFEVSRSYIILKLDKTTFSALHEDQQKLKDFQDLQVLKYFQHSRL